MNISASAQEQDGVSGHNQAHINNKGSSPNKCMLRAFKQQ